ncbi:hypothetical protein M0R72_00895 [Candidatus Pacearchaeota archaeon]|nr:hypothetical protein [Candidatus Pacearchaeota archaeon]
MARSLIRDNAMNWARDELAADPETVCAQLSRMIGEDYNFENGEAKSNHKLTIFVDTVLRKNSAGELFLMNRQEAGWSSSAIPVPNEEYVLERFNVTLGKWTSDKYGECCQVHKEESK